MFDHLQRLHAWCDPEVSQRLDLCRSLLCRSFSRTDKIKFVRLFRLFRVAVSLLRVLLHKKKKKKCTSFKEFVLSVEWTSPTGAADTPSVPSAHHCDHLLTLKLQTKINPMQLQCKPSSTVMLCNRTQSKFFSVVRLVWPTFLAGCDLRLWLYFTQFLVFWRCNIKQ